jgi:hypothetical protein
MPLDIMSMFRPKPAVAIDPNRIDPNANPNAAGNNTLPGGNANPNPGGTGVQLAPDNSGPKDPMANYADLFVVKDTDRKPATSMPSLTIDNKKISEALAGMDTLAGIPAEVLAKAKSGDFDSVTQVIQHSSRQTMQNATAMTAQIVQSTINQLNDHYQKEIIPEILRKQDSRGNGESVVAKLMANPASAPLVTSIRDQFMLKNPTAPGAEIERLTQAYFADFSNMVVGASGKTITDTSAAQGGKGDSAKGNFDWANWASEDVRN